MCSYVGGGCLRAVKGSMAYTAQDNVAAGFEEAPSLDPLLLLVT